MLLEIFGLIFLAAYTGVALLQLGLSRDQERRQLQAYLGIDKIEIPCCGVDVQGKFGYETKNGIHAGVKNVGQTPASDVRVVMQSAEYDFNAPFPANQNYQVPIVPHTPGSIPFVEASVYLLPGQTRVFNGPANPMWAMRIKFRQSRGFLFGTIQFTDVFFTRHLVDFCRIYSVDIDGNEEFGECPSGNGERPLPPHWYSWLLPY